MKNPRNFQTIWMGVFLTCSASASLYAAPVTLDKITTGDNTVTLELSSPAGWSATRVPQDPPRLAIDLNGTLFRAKSSVAGNGDILKNIRAGQYKVGESPVTRVVLDLSAHVEYKASWNGNKLTIVLESNSFVEPPEKIRDAANGFAYKGYLTDSKGHPLSGRYRLDFQIAGTEEGAQPVWEASQYVEVQNGVYDVVLGRFTPMPADALSGGRFISAKPAPLEPALPKNLPFFVQIGAFRDGNRALALEGNLRNQIVGTSVEEVKVKKETLFLVRLGPFKKKSEAQAAKDRLTALGYPGVVRKFK